VGLGAIVLIGAEFEKSSTALPAGSESESLLGASLPCIDILGRSVLERTVERLVRAGVETVSVLVPAEMVHAVPPFSSFFQNVTVQLVADIRKAAIQQCQEFSRCGIEHAYIVSASLYTETDLLDLFYFHREARQAVTRAHGADGPLDLWVVACAKACHAVLEDFLAEAQGTAASYLVRDYVNHLSHPRDLRRLVADSLRGRCAMRPSGTELKPGIWVDEGAEIHRKARIVAPAYIGHDSKVMEDTLITRCSNIERGCCVDYGTVIENSSLLANTHVGIWLDVCHAVVSGNKIMSLGRNVTLEITDRSILRSTSSARDDAKNNISYYVAQKVISSEQQEELQKQPRTPKAWHFGASPIQG
jgi:carbonic anhydrase/acetyltransferase-like protein (isoleucine patch superfamily)